MTGRCLVIYTYIYIYREREREREEQSCEKLSVIYSQNVKKERNILHAIKKRKAYWIGHLSRRNYFLKLVIERNIAGRIDVMGRRGRRRKQLLDDLTERRIHSKLKEEALDRTLWGTRFGRDHVPVMTMIFTRSCMSLAQSCAVRSFLLVCMVPTVAGIRGNSIF